MKEPQTKQIHFKGHADAFLVHHGHATGILTPGAMPSHINVRFEADGHPARIHAMKGGFEQMLEHITAPQTALGCCPVLARPGKLFSNLVNATTMAELTASRVLVPMRCCPTPRSI